MSLAHIMAMCFAPASRNTQERDAPSFVAMRSFHSLVTFLRLYAERGYRARFEAADADRFIRLFTVSVGSVVNPVKRGVNFRDQPALPRPGSQLDGPFGF